VAQPLKSGDSALALLIGAACGLLVQISHLAGHVFVNLDFGVHYNYAREYAGAMAAGNLWPRWAMRAHAGLGEPGLLYYAPLYYWLTALASMVTGNVWAAMQAVEIASTALLGYFSFKLTALYAPGRRALLAAPLACLSPMLVMLHLEFNGYPWACAVTPLAAYFWAILRPQAQTMPVNAPAIVALAFTVLTHTVTGLMAVIVTAPLVLCCLTGNRAAPIEWRRAAAPIVTIAGGLALSAVYLLPAFTLQSLIDSSVWRTHYTPYDAFSLPTITAWLFGIRWAAFQWPISFVMIISALLGSWLTWREQCSQLLPLRLPITVVVGAAVFLSVELSYPLWLIDSPLRDVQFPHRFLTMLTPLLPVLVLAPGSRNRSARFMLRLLAVMGVAIAVLTLAKATVYKGPRVDFSEKTFPTYDGLDEYRTRWTPLERTSRGIAAKKSDCDNGRLLCGPPARTSRGFRWRVIAPQNGLYTLPIYYFPAWQLTANGRAIKIAPDPATGLVHTELPAASAALALAWRPMPEEWIGLAISVVMLLVLILAAAQKRMRPAARQSTQSWCSRTIA